MVPVLRQAVIKPQDGEGVEHILIQGVVIAVDVVGHLHASCNACSSCGQGGKHVPGAVLVLCFMKGISAPLRDIQSNHARFKEHACASGSILAAYICGLRSCVLRARRPNVYGNAFAQIRRTWWW